MTDNFIGIDIAKDTFDIALLRGERCRHEVFANTPAGFADLADWLHQHTISEAHLCLEATGTYGLALATWLHEAGWKVSVVNPACIKAFAQSELRRTKTDRVDAGVIARFCRAMQPPAWQPISETQAVLQSLVRRLQALQKMHTQERARLAAPGLLSEVDASIRRLLAYLQDEQTEILRQIAAHVARHPKLRAQRDLIDSIPGIGQETATLLLAELVLPFRSARQLAAYAGLVPKEQRSGSSVRGKTKLSKQGTARLRHALYWPAVTALRVNPAFRAFAQRLTSEGRPKLVIIAAVMRKLLHLVFGVLKTRQPFSYEYHAQRA